MGYLMMFDVDVKLFAAYTSTCGPVVASLIEPDSLQHKRKPREDDFVHEILPQENAGRGCKKWL